MEVLELDFADIADDDDDEGTLLDLDLLVLQLGIDLLDEREDELPVDVLLVTGVQLILLLAFLVGFEEFEIDETGVVDPPPLSFTLSLLDDTAWPLTAAVEGTGRADVGWQLLSDQCVCMCECECLCKWV